MRVGKRLGVPFCLFFMVWNVSGCRPKHHESENRNPSFLPYGPPGPSAVFHNPVVETGADPWVIHKDGFYYYCMTDGKTSISVAKAKNLHDIGKVPAVKVWQAPPGTDHSGQHWAAELHFLDGRWYIYYAASQGDNASHRMFVLESEAVDPLGPYGFKGRLATATDRWAIDGTVLEAGNGKRYFVWSGWEGHQDFAQNLYIAPMVNPWTLQQPDLPFIPMEAEQAVLSQATIRTTRSASGERSVSNIDSADSFVEFSFEAPRAGPYQIDIRYSNGTQALSTHVLSLNDGAKQVVPYPPSGWENFQTVQAFTSLAAGPNILRLAKGDGSAELDRIEVKPTGTDRIVLSLPEHDYEKKGGPAYVNEGPQILKKNGKIHIIYSGSGSWTDDYNLIQLTFQGGDILDRQNWVKRGPVFARTADVFGPGHASFTQSPDGNEDWIVYHAALHRGAGWRRNVRTQPFQWDLDDNPVFGQPLPPHTPIPWPSGSN
ncbi:MAG TPA: family 43 glycosylhydrolase [Oligoflexus sp.]|uniref:family 43 glycosylhydrolase n=1 Tax=Oligoflexus sp. TaxID=1971216 RepID=UPI002D5C287C|nr:family 43 glycosylhydrolase [Oligoflexus sp.]HYX35640.1 family 43 glycosylhydrolase [Oligoflexus sp.]